MWKKASICSSERPLVSGTQQPVKSRLSRQMAEKKKKGTWRPKAFCSGELGRESLSRHSPQPEFHGLNQYWQPVGHSSGHCSATSQLSLLFPSCPSAILPGDSTLLGTTPKPQAAFRAWWAACCISHPLNLNHLSVEGRFWLVLTQLDSPGRVWSWPAFRCF